MTLRRYPTPKGWEPQQNRKMGEITFRNKTHTLQRHSKGSNKSCAHQNPVVPQRLRQNCVWVSPAEERVSSGLLQGQELWVQQTWLWHKSFWRRLPLTPPQRCQNLQRTGETDSWRVETKPWVHKKRGERSSDSTKRPRLYCECSGVSGGGMGQWWPAAELGELHAAVFAWDFWRKLSLSSLTPPYFGLWSNNRSSFCPTTEN